MARQRRRNQLPHRLLPWCCAIAGVHAFCVSSQSYVASSAMKEKPQRRLIARHVNVQELLEAPTKIQQQVQESVDKTIDNFSRDDGRVLDTSSASGYVGSIAVSLAVLPYIPLSFYSSYLVLTTGAGIEPGPYGIYGFAEGFATLAIWAVVAWSLTSLVTRARGLPEGPYNILGVTQGLSYLAAITLVGVSLLTGGSNLNPLSDGKAPNGFKSPLDDVTATIQKQASEMSKGSSKSLAWFSKSLDDQIEAAKTSVNSQASKVVADASSQVSKAIEKTAGSAGEIISKVPALQKEMPSAPVTAESPAPQVQASEKVKTNQPKAETSSEFQDLFD